MRGWQVLNVKKVNSVGGGVVGTTDKHGIIGNRNVVVKVQMHPNAWIICKTCQETGIWRSFSTSAGSW